MRGCAHAGYSSPKTTDARGFECRRACFHATDAQVWKTALYEADEKLKMLNERESFCVCVETITFSSHEFSFSLHPFQLSTLLPHEFRSMFIFFTLFFCLFFSPRLASRPPTANDSSFTTDFSLACDYKEGASKSWTVVPEKKNKRVSLTFLSSRFGGEVF